MKWIGLFLTDWLLFAGSLSSCECGDWLPVARAFHDVDVVAVATVTRIHDQWTLWRRIKNRLGLHPAITGDLAQEAHGFGYRVTLRVERW